MSPQNDGGRLGADRIPRIRPELNKRTPEQVKAAEQKARAEAEKAARNPEERKSFLSYLFGKDS